MNVCIYRIPRGLSIVSPGSACPACGSRLRARELIPLASYLALRGKCSSCGARISPRYPVVELLCGALWAALFYKFSLSLPFFCYATLCSILLAVVFIDLEFMRIPNALVACALAPALVAALKHVFFSSGAERFAGAYGSLNAAEPLLGLIPCAFFLCVFIVSAIAGGGAAAVGMGDIKLLVPIGIALGLKRGALALFIAVLCGGLTGVALMAFGIKKRKDPIPFGPFLVIGVYAAIFLPIPMMFYL